MAAHVVDVMPPPFLALTVHTAHVAHRLATERVQRGLSFRGRVLGSAPASAVCSKACVPISAERQVVGGTDMEPPHLEAGRYFYAIRLRAPGADSFTFLPAFAEVLGPPHTGFAKFAVFAKPLPGVTDLALLRAWSLSPSFSEGSVVDLVPLLRLGDFDRKSTEAIGCGLAEVTSAQAWASRFPVSDEDGAEFRVGSCGLVFDDPDVAIELPEADVAVEDGQASCEVMFAEQPKGGTAARVIFANGSIRISVEEELGSQQIIGQDEDVTGHRVWPTATIFCKYLCDHKALLENKRVLDLGAGTGLVGLVAARLGAQATLVDVPHVVPLLARNAAADAADNRGGGLEVDLCVRELWWGDEEQCAALVADRGPFDVVLCCELVYQQYPEVLDLLLATLRALVAPHGQVLFAYQFRDGGGYSDADFFRKLGSSGFSAAPEEGLDAWDESWDECCRWVRTYTRDPDE